MQDINDHIRTICARLLDTPSGSPEIAEYHARLKRALAILENQEENWNKPAEHDTHYDEARQSYRSRETDSADGFSESLKLFNPKKKDADKKKE